MSRTLRLIGTLAALTAVVALGSPSLAKTSKGGGGTPTQGTSSIAIDTVTNGDGTAFKMATGSVQPRLGSKVTFATTIQPLSGWEHAMVDVTCYQDVNGDGKVDTTLLGPDIVFSDLDTPDATYTLGGFSSIWTIRGGGDATCRADLVAVGWKSGAQSARNLSTTGQWAAQG
jgi:hypothetical protein